MNEERTRQGNGPAREPPRRVTMGNGERKEALGDVARDMMDQATVMARDRVRIAKLEARRWVEHLKADVAPRALWMTVAAVTAGLAGLCTLIAVFWGIASALGSVPWTFAIFAGIFAVAATIAIGFGNQPARMETTEIIERRFPAVRAHEEETPVHALVRQERPEEHRKVVVEAQREAEREREMAAARTERAALPEEPRPPERR